MIFWYHLQDVAIKIGCGRLSRHSKLRNQNWHPNTPSTIVCSSNILDSAKYGQVRVRWFSIKWRLARLCRTQLQRDQPQAGEGIAKLTVPSYLCSLAPLAPELACHYSGGVSQTQISCWLWNEKTSKPEGVGLSCSYDCMILHVCSSSILLVLDSNSSEPYAVQGAEAWLEENLVICQLPSPEISGRELLLSPSSVLRRCPWDKCQRTSNRTIQRKQNLRMDIDVKKKEKWKEINIRRLQSFG